MEPFIIMVKFSINRKLPWSFFNSGGVSCL
jgi:hypothetical protein